MNQYDQTFGLKIHVGHCDLYFMVQWFCLISWRLFDVLTSFFGIMNQYDPTFNLKINVGHCDLYFMVQWFCVTSWILFDVWTSIFGIMGQYDARFDLKINVGLCDLYFMVQWFCLISPTLFDAWVSYFQIMRQFDPKIWPQSKYKSTWPIFHGLVILHNIFKIMWWMNIIVGIRATENRFFAGSDRFLVCKTDSICIKHIFFGPKNWPFPPSIYTSGQFKDYRVLEK